MNTRISNPIASSILVTGGTGTLGRHVVALLRDGGSDVRVLSRRSREGAEEGIEFQTDDLATGEQGMAKLPVIPVPAGFKFQPIDSAEVAARLVELALGTPAGLVPDIAGPRVYEMGNLVRSYLEATHRRRLILPLKMPGKAAQAIRDGANLSPDRAVGRRTREELLAAQVNRGAGGLRPEHLSRRLTF